MTSADRQRLRPTVYLYRGLDDALMVALESLSRRRKAGRLLELIQQGLQGEALERANAGPVYGELRSATPARAKMPVPLRIDQAAHPALYDTLERAQNRAERLRILAAKGLRREARLHQPAAPLPSVPNPPEDPQPTVARKLMASMVAALQKGDLL